MERIAKEGMWLTKEPTNKKSRSFSKRVTAPTQEALNAYEDVTDEYKQNYEKQMAELRRQEIEAEEAEEEE